MGGAGTETDINHNASNTCLTIQLSKVITGWTNLLCAELTKIFYFLQKNNAMLHAYKLKYTYILFICSQCICLISNILLRHCHINWPEKNLYRGMCNIYFCRGIKCEVVVFVVRVLVLYSDTLLRLCRILALTKYRGGTYINVYMEVLFKLSSNYRHWLS